MTKKKKIALVLASITLIAALTIGGTLAYFTDTESRENIITLGKVSGTLTETDEEMREDGTTGKDYTNVKPGEVLAKDPKVTLDTDSEKAYARVKITYEGLTDEQSAQLAKGIALETGWNMSDDGYAYYNEILNPGDSTFVLKTVTIPGKEWDNEMAEKTFKINVVAELIQSDNFTPVITGGVITGWENVEIKAAN